MTASKAKKKAGSATRIRVRQTRGMVNRTTGVIDTLVALGLGRVGKISELPLNASVAGMIRKVEHLVVVERI